MKVTVNLTKFHVSSKRLQLTKNSNLYEADFKLTDVVTNFVPRFFWFY